MALIRFFYGSRQSVFTGRLDPAQNCGAFSGESGDLTEVSERWRWSVGPRGAQKAEA